MMIAVTRVAKMANLAACLLLALFAGFEVQAQSVVINEVLASNGSVLADVDGEFGDWVELYNPGPTAVNLQGFTLSDDPAQPQRWIFPSVEIPAGGFLLVWASGKDRSSGQLHSNFSLKASGEFIGLFRPDGGVVDQIEFGQQALDISLARIPNGTGDFDFSDPPTPAEANQDNRPGPPGVTLTAPNGGEAWEAGTQQTISWATSGIVGDVTIEFSSDQGATWSVVDEQTNNDGQKPWIVPNQVSSTCLVRITSLDDPDINDGSDSVFRILAATRPARITVSAPNGGENWRSGDSETITWTSEGPVDEVTLAYARDGESDWQTIDDQTINDGKKPWTIPEIPSGDYRIRIMSLSNENVFDISDNVFAIQGVSGPSVTLTWPNGGEALQGGSEQTITWTSVGNADSLRIELSTDNGASWEVVDDRTQDDGKKPWTVPQISSDQCLIRIVAIGDGSVFDISDGPFSIAHINVPASLTLEAPVGGETWAVGSEQRIQWSSTGDIETIRIEYSINGGSSWEILDDSTPNDTRKSWVVPDQLSDRCLIRIHATDSDASDESPETFAIITPPTGDSKLVINEIMAANEATLRDEDGEYSDWIELYNTGSAAINLFDYFVSDDPLNIHQWRLPDIDLPGGGYVVLFTSGKDRIGAELHTNFKLSASGEYIGLYTRAAEIIDARDFGEQFSDISLARIANGSGDFELTINPTPGESNLSGRPPFGSLTFSPAGGFYGGSVTVEISANVADVDIRYTTDGSAVTSSSTRYTGPIELRGNEIVRARAFQGNAAVSSDVSQFYAIDTEGILPILSLATNEDNLYGSSGIFTNYNERGRDWERPVSANFIEPDGSGVQINAGIRIHGQHSRKYPKKSMRLYFRQEYGDGKLDYDLFPNTEVRRFDALVIHAGGSEDQYYVDDKWTLIRDPLLHELWRDFDGNVSSSRPVQLYINGSFHGIYQIRERIDNSYLESYFNIFTSDLLKWWHNPTPQIEEGDLTNWNAVYSFFEDNAMSSDGNYDRALEMINVDNFIDYQIIEIYSAHKDWPHNNNLFFRERTPDSKWNWLLWDIESTMFAKDRNSLAWASRSEPMPSISPSDNEDQLFATLLFRRLLENDRFVQQFVTRFSDILNTALTPGSASWIFEAMVDEIRYDIPLEVERWDASLQNWQDGIALVREFIADRPRTLRSHMRSFFDLGGDAGITLGVSDPSMGQVRINTIVPEDYPWTGLYFSGQPIELEAIPAANHRFTGWSDGLGSSPVARFDLNGDKTITANFKPDGSGLTIISPNGGESLLPGQIATILWGSYGTSADVKLEYSLNGGVTWSEITARTPDSGEFSWTVPDTQSTTVLLRVSDADQGILTDISDGLFAITADDPLPPVPLGNMDIIINCDDEFELWVNGNHIGANRQWDQAMTYSVPLQPGKNVIAVHAINQGFPGAMIAEVSIDGELVLVTDESWRRFGTESPGWNTNEFDDQTWLYAVDHGRYGVKPWSESIHDFPTGSQAHWIWGEVLKEDYREWYFRGSFEVEQPLPPAPEIAGFTPEEAQVGAQVTVHGQHFINVSEVLIGSQRADQFSISSESEIQLIIPAGATGGRISVVTAQGTATSSSDLVVLPPPRDRFQLAINVNGSGAVGRDPDLNDYEEGTAVGLTATAAAGWRFAGWSGDLSGAANPDTVAMDANKTIGAVFEQIVPERFTLNLETVGQGTISADPAAADYAAGAQVVLTATAEPGWEFIGWSGALEGPGNPDTLTLAGNAQVTATFTTVSPPVVDLGEMEIIINSDDVFELWVNGEFIGSDDQWDQARRYFAPIRLGRNVLAIQGTNLGFPGATIAEVRVDGELVLVTDSNWRRFGDEVAGWESIGFDDQDWPAAVDHGRYGSDPWGKGIANFPNNSLAHWIWGEVLKEDYRRWFFRGSFEQAAPEPAPEIAAVDPDSGLTGAEVSILGKFFNHVEAVAFDGRETEEFVVVSENQIRATVPSGASTGHIRVQASAGSGTSPEVFKVLVPPAPDPTLTLISPNGGEVLSGGDSHRIEWESLGDISQVHLEYSLDGGSNWLEIRAATGNDGRFGWTVPNVAGDRVLVRISDAATGTPFDVSDAVFTIQAAPIDLGEMEIIINCDDEYQLWVNGDHIGGDDRWDVAQVYSVPVRSGANVLAVHGVNTGFPGALLVQVKVDGEIRLMTDEGWRRSGTETAGWTEIAFDDSHWAAAVDHGRYGGDPWGRQIANFPTDSPARWIWGEVLREDYREWYFRGSFDQALSKIAAEPNPQNQIDTERGRLRHRLGQNFPNPFNSETTISYELPEPGSVEINIYDLSGRLIRTLVHEEKAAGSYFLNWNGRNQAGIGIASGVYLLRMVAGSFVEIRKITYLQ